MRLPCALWLERGRGARLGYFRGWETVSEAGARRVKPRPAHYKEAGGGEPLPFLKTFMLEKRKLQVIQGTFLLDENGLAVPLR